MKNNTSRLSNTAHQKALPNPHTRLQPSEQFAYLNLLSVVLAKPVDEVVARASAKTTHPQQIVILPA